MAAQLPLKVGVIGAGIAGLAAAIGLRRAGHDVEVFERSEFRSELGAAITMTSNATRVLDYWGLDYEKAGAVENRQLRIYDGTSSEMWFQDSFDKDENKYGAKTWFFHRVDLHNALKDIAQNSQSSQGKPAVIRLASEVVEVECEEGTLTLADGKKVQKDLLVIADGAHCRFGYQVSGQELPMQSTGRSAYRCLIPFDKIMQDETTRSFFENELDGWMVPFLWAQPAVNIVACVTYPCRRGELLNCAIIHKTREEHRDKHDWNSDATLDELLDTVKDLYPSARSLLKKADDVKVYTIMDHAPLSCVSRGKIVLIGDAAHPMAPTHAQGGALSIEDAGALEILFADISSRDEVSKRLQLFQELRVPRNATTQILSNEPFRNPEKMEGMVRQFYSGPLPPADAMPYSEPIRDFFYSYNVFEETAKFLKDSCNR